MHTNASGNLKLQTSNTKPLRPGSIQRITGHLDL